MSNITGKAFKKLSCGLSHVVAIALDGTLYGWGDTSCYKLATNPSKKQHALIPSLINVKAIQATL